MSSKRILMIIGDFGEDYEIIIPLQALQAVGHDVHAVCPEKNGGETVKTAIHGFRGDQPYLEERGHDFELTDSRIRGVNPPDHDALVVPGGRAPEYLRGYDAVLVVVRHFFDADKPIATLCHGPQILATTDVIDGYEMTSYPAVRPEVEAAGCT